MESFAKSIASGVIAIVIVAVLWQGAAMITGNAMFVPTLPAVLARLGTLCINLAFWGQVLASLQHLVLGFVPALIGIPIGLGLAAVAPLRLALGGFFNGLAAIPLIASVPLMTVWFGLADGSKILLVFVVAGFALASEVMTGLARNAASDVAPDQAPGTARCIVAALRRSFLLAVTAMLVGEMFASSRGLGYLLMTSTSMLDVPQTAAILLLVGLPTAVVAAILRAIEERV